MTREEYIDVREKNPSLILYDYYKENYKGENLLSQGDFFMAIRMWPFATQVLEELLQKLDVMFEITSIQDLKTGQTIKYY